MIARPLMCCVTFSSMHINIMFLPQFLHNIFNSHSHSALTSCFQIHFILTTHICNWILYQKNSPSYSHHLQKSLLHVSMASRDACRLCMASGENPMVCHESTGSHGDRYRPLTGVVGPLPNGRFIGFFDGGDPDYLRYLGWSSKWFPHRDHTCFRWSGSVCALDGWVIAPPTSGD